MPAIWIFLKSVPIARWLQLGVVLLVLALFADRQLVIHGLTVQVAQAQTAQARAEKATADERAGRAADNAHAQADAARAAVNALRTSAQITNDQQEIEDAHSLIAKQHQAVVAASDAVHRSLLNAFRAAATAAASCGSGSSGAATLAGSTPGAGAGDLRSDVFGESDARSGTLADSLDGERAGHAACVAEYRSVESRINGQRAGEVTK